MIDVENYLNHFFKGTKNQSLDTMQYFVREYSNFQKDMKFIHIAGTNGKGSCTEMISNILFHQGYRVGKFISPHLIQYCERISINGKQITQEEMSDLIEEIQTKMNNNNQKVTLFELETMIALLYFYRKKVDFVVLETGLGGRYDCTNIIPPPFVSIITSIGYDHMSILGNTLSQITYQKAGIIKENSHTIFFEQSKEINEQLIRTCHQKNNEMHLVTKNKIKNYHYDKEFQYFDYEKIKNIKINLKGVKQIQNAAISIETIQLLNKLGYPVSEESLRKGLSTVVHKGRMEELNSSPLIVFDGAHNESAISNLQNSIHMYYKNNRRTYIISILKTKDYPRMLSLLLQDENAIFLLTSGNDKRRYVSNEDLYRIAMLYQKKGQQIEKKTLVEAIEFAMSNPLVNLVVGSFYVYGDVIEQIERIKSEKREKQE